MEAGTVPKTPGTEHNLSMGAGLVTLSPHLIFPSWDFQAILSPSADVIVEQRAQEAHLWGNRAAWTSLGDLGQPTVNKSIIFPPWFPWVEAVEPPTHAHAHTHTEPSIFQLGGVVPVLHLFPSHNSPVFS